MAPITAWVLGDQLSAQNPALRDADRVLLIQSTAALPADGAQARRALTRVIVALGAVGRHPVDDAQRRAIRERARTLREHFDA